MSLPTPTLVCARRGELGSQRWEVAAAAQRGLSQRETRRDLGPGRGPIQRAQTSKKPERATLPQRRAQISRATPRAVAGGGGPQGGGGRSMATGASLGRRVASRPAVLLGSRFLSLCITHETVGRRRDPVGRAAQPCRCAQALGLRSTVHDWTQPPFPGTEHPRAFLLILTPHPHPQPHRPLSPRIVSYPVHGACSAVPDVYSSTAPQLQPPSSSPAAAGSA